MVQFLLGLLLIAQVPPSLLLKELEPQQQPAPVAQVAPATQPAAQVTIVTSTQPATSQPATTQPAELEHIDFMRVFRGEQTLTPEQVFQLGSWMQFAVDTALTIIGFIPRLFVAIFLFFIFWVIYRAVRKIVSAAMKRAHVDDSIRDMLCYILKWAILGFGLVIAGNQIGIQIAALLTGVSIIGLAIGFAAQETLANFIAGIVIFWDKPFKVGDWIVVDDVFGQVQRVTFRSSRLLNLDGEVVVFPNTYMLSNKLVNNSTHPVNRVHIPIGIAYKESIERARQALLSITRGDDRVCKTPAPEVVVVACGASSIDLELRVWVADESIERKLVYEYLEKGKNALDAAGIEIPFPHMQLFLEQTEAVSQLAGRIAPGRDKTIP